MGVSLIQVYKIPGGVERVGGGGLLGISQLLNESVEAIFRTKGNISSCSKYQICEALCQRV